MNKRLLIILVLLSAVLPISANVSLFEGAGNPFAARMGPRPTGDVYVPEVIVCGAQMFLAAAMCNHTDKDGYDFYANNQALRLVYNSMTYLLDPENQSITSGTIGCMGDFGYPNGLQEGYPVYPPWDIDFMQYVEENLASIGCSFDLVHIKNTDPLVDGGQILYDIVMIGEQWFDGLLHTRSEYTSYVALGGKLIIAGAWNKVPDPSGMQLHFLPKNTIWVKRFSVTEFLLPALDPSHPIARNINNPIWWYEDYEPFENPLNPHIYMRILNYDEDYYTKIFTNHPDYPDSPTTLTLGGQWVQSRVEETSWGAIKAQF